MEGQKTNNKQKMEETKQQVNENNNENNDSSKNQIKSEGQKKQQSVNQQQSKQQSSNHQQSLNQQQSSNQQQQEGQFVSIGHEQDWQDQQLQESQESLQQSASQLLNQLSQQSSNQQNSDPNKHKCAHYERQCYVQAPCCKIFYPCKLCHDQKYQYKKGCQVQRMAFEQVKNVKCLNCQLIQPSSNNCINQKCNTKFGQYACLKCMLYQNNPKKVNDIFHCDDCKMCRRGSKTTTFHCFKCGYCRPISEQNGHKCNQNVAQSKCPICLQVLKYSTKYYQSLPCGHLIHSLCLTQVRSINCPVCGMAIQKISKSQNERIQQMINLTKNNLPQQLKNHKVNVMCNQCLHKTMNAQFHFYGTKCQKCGTFNTKMI